ncbi:MAG: nitroreductase family protein [Eubacteriales bacterium]|nr:nitroreductase family protein [Eubacteriales bacterium]
MDAIRKRSSCRDFSDKKVAAEDVDKLLEAALASPTAMDSQLLRFALISNEQLIQKISDHSFERLDEGSVARMKARKAKNLFYGAPVVMVISSVPARCAHIDAGLAAQSVCLTAEELGLSSCIIGMSRVSFAEDDPNHLRDVLKMEEDERFVISIALGYAQSRKEPHELSWDHVRRF